MHERVGEAGYFFEFQPFYHFHSPFLGNEYFFAVPPVVEINRAVFEIKVD